MNTYLWLVTIIIFIVLILLLQRSAKNLSENFMFIDALDIERANKEDIILRQMLYDISELLKYNGITFWMGGHTLLGAIKYKNTLPNKNGLDIHMLATDDNKLLDLTNILNGEGYNIIKMFFGYRIYPLNGINVKLYDHLWYPDEQPNYPQDSEVIKFKYPYIDILLFRKLGNKYVYLSSTANRLWDKFYYNENELFPLKEYKIADFTLPGPNNEKVILNRFFEGQKYQHRNNRMIPLITNKIFPRDR